MSDKRCFKYLEVYMWLMSYADLLLLISFGSVCMDVRDGKVQNPWLALCALCGLGLRYRLAGSRAFLAGMTAMFIPFLLLGWLFIFRMIGAGDIKLLCALGSFLDPLRSFYLVFGSLFFGAILSLLIMLRRGAARARLQYLITYIRSTAASGKVAPYIKNGVNREENIPFTIPVLFSTAALCLGGIIQ